MCTISPKLVEAGRHNNIEILTQTEVMGVTGQAGNFQVRLQSQPRYVDLESCVACNDCVDVCPVIVPDDFNEGLVQKRAIYKRYPQAFPNAYGITKLGIAPCRDACPQGQRAQGYIALIREGRWDDALRVIKMDNPFPGICGRICNHRCEEACNRVLVDEPINIRALKRFVTDKVYENERQPIEPAERLHSETVAIIGAGPCGLTAAQDLVQTGYGVTIFEAMPVAGGMLRLGVPEYRLPTEIIEREVQDIIDQGVELHLDHQINDLDALFTQGFDAVLIAVGAHEGIRLPIPGSDLEGVIINTHFLRDVRLGRYDDPGPNVPKLGHKVVVLGGGNVAIDCARSAIRLGCEVELACLESREQMPAHSWEVDAAEAEGVVIHAGHSFERIQSGSDGRVQSMVLGKVESFHFDESGRLNLVKVPDSEISIDCDSVIFSVGQRAGLAFIPDDAGVGMTSQQTIAINPNTMAATRPGVFAAGDSVSGTAFVIEAVASGHTAAQSIIRYLRGEQLEPPPKPDLPVVVISQEEIEGRLARGEIQRQPRVPMPELPVSQRSDNFAEVEGGYDDESAQAEAARCLACGICSECMSCVFACGRDAIDHDQVAVDQTIDVGAIVLAPGYQTYQAELAEEFGYGRYPNVVTSLQFERLLSASGPTMGHIHRPSDHETPRRIAFLQCIGSRDQDHDYCSAVCCMYAAKEAMIAKEHDPSLEIDVFLMDMRAFSKGYWRYFEQARDRYGIRFTRCRISQVFQDPETHNLVLQSQDETGRLSIEEYDLVVLSVGMEISPEVQDLGRRLGVELDEYGFCHTARFNPLETSQSGIYAIGPFREPKDIPESVIESSGAAAAVAQRLSPARFSLTTTPTFPPEIDISDQEARIGVFVCHCGSNIGGYLDVPEVTEFAAGLPHVTHAEANLYTCSQDSIEHITETVKEMGLNRVVVASCTPLTHQPLFQDSIRSAGLNPFLFEMANIRNQCSWVHSDDQPAATAKAKELVHMAVARAALLEAQTTMEVPVNPTALVVGGGAAGMTAALALAGQGFPVHLVEREPQLGGNLLHVRLGHNAKDPQEILAEFIEQVQSHPNIQTHVETEVVASRGFMGSFSSTLERDGDQIEIDHGATILATGGREYRGPEFGYGTDPRVVTQQEFEQQLFSGDAAPQRVVMIQCIGPAETYCSRICCTTALKNALQLKQRNPEAEITILHRDIRTYGFKERLYQQTREAGVIFIRYPDDQPPRLDLQTNILVEVDSLEFERTIQLNPDQVVLSMPIVPQEDAKQISKRFKVPLDSDGFFLEAHVKLRPVDFSSEGVFMAGMAHYPKLLDETMIQAFAAASRAARVLSRETLSAGGRVAVVDPSQCTGCLTCLRTCPFGVPIMQSTQSGVGAILGAAMIEPAVCQGCGSCVAECPAQAIELKHFTDAQLQAKVHALLSGPVRIER
jgi:heterodisulfide reductase subunit A-like polyferredoxin